MGLHAARVAAAVLASAGLAGALGVAAPAAEAQSISVSCETSGEAHFDPGVHVIPFPQEITLFGEERQCQNNSSLPIESATLSGSIRDALLSCEVGFGGGGEGSGTIEWELENGETVSSIVEMDVDFTALWTASLSGVVLDGVFEGEEFTFSLTVDPLDAVFGCVTFGVDEIDYEGTFAVG